MNKTYRIVTSELIKQAGYAEQFTKKLGELSFYSNFLVNYLEKSRNYIINLNNVKTIQGFNSQLKVALSKYSPDNWKFILNGNHNYNGNLSFMLICVLMLPKVKVFDPVEKIQKTIQPNEIVLQMLFQGLKGQNLNRQIIVNNYKNSYNQLTRGAKVLSGDQNPFREYTGWILIPSIDEDDQHYLLNTPYYKRVPENIRNLAPGKFKRYKQCQILLRTLSQGTGWCTGQGMQKTYLPQGQFWLYLEKGKSKLAIRVQNEIDQGQHQTEGQPIYDQNGDTVGYEDSEIEYTKDIINTKIQEIQGLHNTNRNAFPFARKLVELNKKYHWIGIDQHEDGDDDADGNNFNYSQISKVARYQDLLQKQDASTALEKDHETINYFTPQIIRKNSNNQKFKNLCHDIIYEQFAQATDPYDYLQSKLNTFIFLRTSQTFYDLTKTLILNEDNSTLFNILKMFNPIFSQIKTDKQIYQKSIDILKSYTVKLILSSFSSKIINLNTVLHEPRIQEGIQTISNIFSKSRQQIEKMAVQKQGVISNIKKDLSFQLISRKDKQKVKDNIRLIGLQFPQITLQNLIDTPEFIQTQIHEIEQIFLSTRNHGIAIFNIQGLINVNSVNNIIQKKENFKNELKNIYQNLINLNKVQAADYNMSKCVEIFKQHFPNIIKDIKIIDNQKNEVSQRYIELGLKLIHKKDINQFIKLNQNYDNKLINNEKIQKQAISYINSNVYRRGIYYYMPNFDLVLRIMRVFGSLIYKGVSFDINLAIIGNMFYDTAEARMYLEKLSFIPEFAHIKQNPTIMLKNETLKHNAEIYFKDVLENGLKHYAPNILQNLIKLDNVFNKTFSNNQAIRHAILSECYKLINDISFTNSVDSVYLQKFQQLNRFIGGIASYNQNILSTLDPKVKKYVLDFKNNYAKNYTSEQIKHMFSDELKGTVNIINKLFNHRYSALFEQVVNSRIQNFIPPIPAIPQKKQVIAKKYKITKVIKTSTFKVI